MNTKQMELVLDLSRTLNFRQTAENMYISQPALTHQIKTMEEELGFQLFNRSTQGVSLTPAGKLFCQNIGTVYTEIQRSVNTGRNCSRQYNDSLSFSINPQRHISQMSEILRNFSLKYEDVMIQIKKINGTEKINAFLRREIDISFFINDTIKNTLDLKSEKLYESKLYCVVKKDDSLAEKNIIRAEDLESRTILMASAAPKYLLNAQNDLKKKVKFNERYSQSLDEAMLWVQAIDDSAALVPGFCFSNNPEYEWIPYDWEETLPIKIAWHNDDDRHCIIDLVEITKDVFKRSADNGLVL